MTASTLSGMALDDTPAEYFEEPFETWTGKLPALVIASILQYRLAPTASGDWPQHSVVGTGRISSMRLCCSWISVRKWRTWSEGLLVLFLLMSIWGILNHCLKQNAGQYCLIIPNIWGRWPNMQRCES